MAHRHYHERAGRAGSFGGGLGLCASRPASSWRSRRPQAGRRGRPRRSPAPPRPWSWRRASRIVSASTDSRQAGAACLHPVRRRGGDHRPGHRQADGQVRRTALTAVALPGRLARRRSWRRRARRYPRECCGLLEGVFDGDVHAQSRRCIRRATCQRDRHRFEIDPADHIAAQKAARAQRPCHHRLLSFPSATAAPQPSATDLAGAEQDDFSG